MKMYAFYKTEKAIKPFIIFAHREIAENIAKMKTGTHGFKKAVLRIVEVNEYELFDMWNAGVGYPNKFTVKKPASLKDQHSIKRNGKRVYLCDGWCVRRGHKESTLQKKP